jgi:hypothetical protein
MAVSDSRARTGGDRRRLVLVTPEWSTQQRNAFADEVIDRFFAALRHTYREVGDVPPADAG